MAASNTDKLRKNAPNFASSLNGSISPSDTTIVLQSITGLPTDTAVTMTIDATDANGNLTPTIKEVVRGVVNVGGVSLVNCVRGVEGTAQAHSSGAKIVGWFTANDWDTMIDHNLTQHKQDGTHTGVTTDTLGTSGNATIGGTLTSTGLVTASGGLTLAGALTVPDGTITPKMLVAGTGTTWPWTAYTPTWTSSGTQPAIGNGVLTGSYQQIGKTIFFKMTLTAGSTTTYGTGNYRFSYPVTSWTPTTPQAAMPIGGGHYVRQGVANYLVFPLARAAVTTYFEVSVSVAAGGAGTYNTETSMTNTIPATFANTDILNIQGIYEAA